MRKLTALALLSALIISGASIARPGLVQAAELVMFETRYCTYCRLFDRKVAPQYSRSRAGRILPIKKIDIDRKGTAGYPLRSAIIATPTFVLFHRGRERARITGYPGKKSFFLIVNKMLKMVH